MRKERRRKIRFNSSAPRDGEKQAGAKVVLLGKEKANELKGQKIGPGKQGQARGE